MAQLFAALHYNNRYNPYSITCSYYNLSRALSIIFSSTRIDLSVIKFYCVKRFILHNLAFARHRRWPTCTRQKVNITSFFLHSFSISSALITIDFCISCARNSSAPDKRLYISYLIFYPLLYNLDTSLIINRKRIVDIKIKNEDLFPHAILIPLLLLPHLLY